MTRARPMSAGTKAFMSDLRCGTGRVVAQYRSGVPKKPCVPRCARRAVPSLAYAEVAHRQGVLVVGDLEAAIDRDVQRHATRRIIRYRDDVGMAREGRVNAVEQCLDNREV